MPPAQQEHQGAAGALPLNAALLTAQPRLAGRLEGELDRREGAQTPNLAWDSPRKLVAWLSQMEGREVCPPEDLRVSIVAPPDNSWSEKSGSLRVEREPKIML